MNTIELPNEVVGTPLEKCWSVNTFGVVFVPASVSVFVIVDDTTNGREILKLPPATRTIDIGLSMNAAVSVYADSVKPDPVSDPLSTALVLLNCQRVDPLV